MSKETVEEATKNLWDYINSLPPDRREDAIAFQRSLEAEAAITEGGMQTVITKQLTHQTMLLAEVTNEMYEIAAEHATRMTLRDIMAKPNIKE